MNYIELIKKRIYPKNHHTYSVNHIIPPNPNPKILPTHPIRHGLCRPLGGEATDGNRWL